MKKHQFSEEAIVTILREAEATSVEATAKKRAVSPASIYAWRRRFGGMAADDVKRLRQLESENAKLKKRLADRLLEIDILKEFNPKKVVGVPARRGQVAAARARGLSQRRACALFVMTRAVFAYQAQRAVLDAPAIVKLREWSALTQGQAIE